MPSSSVYGQVLDSVKAAVVALGTGVSNVEIQEVADHHKDLPKSFLSISPYGAETIAPATNARPDVTYPVLVAYIADPDVSALDARLLIRQKLRRRFHEQRIGSITGGDEIETRVDPMNAVEVDAYKRRKLFVSSIVVLCKVREAKS